MKKALRTASGTLGRCLLMMFMTLVSLSASATDFTDYTLGEKVTISGDSYFKFTASSDGILTFVGASSGSINLFEDEAMTTEVTGKASFGTKTYNGESFGRYKEFSVKSGLTYYFSVLNVWLLGSADKYVLGYIEAGVTSLTLVESNYSEGDMFDITDTRYGQLQLTFNLAASSDSATIAVPSKGLSAKIDARTGNGSSIIYQLKDTLNAWLAAGSIEGGEVLTFTAPNVHARTDETIKYGEDGTFKMSFTCPAKAHQLVDSYVPSTFKSYYVKGSSEGIVRLTFDYDVAPIGEQTVVAVFRLGSADAGDIYTEQFDAIEGGKISVDGKNLYIDFTDSLRTYETMGLASQWSNVTLSVRNVKMADGTNAYSSGAGTSGSFTFTASFSEVSSYVNYEWTPAEGSDISERDNIELWFSSKDALTFTGVKFYYQDVTTDKYYQTIVTEGITSTEEDGITYTIPLTETIKAAKNVRVSLDGVTALDGTDHSEITVKYNPGPELTDDFDPSTVSPENGSTVSTLDEITLTFDEDVKLNEPAGTKQVIFTDATTGKNVPATIAVSETNAKQVVIMPGETLKNTHKYTVAVGHAVLSNSEYVESAGKYGRFMKELDLTYTIYTASQNYDFDMDPLEGSTLNEISSIKITTKAGRNSNTYGISSTSNPDKEIWIEKDGAKVATAKVVDIVSTSADEPSGFYITFSPAITEAGSYEVVLGDSTYYVGEGNEAEPNSAEVRLAYTVIAAPAQTITPTDINPASESTVEKLQTITLTFDEDIYGVETPITALNRATRTSVTGVIGVSLVDKKKAIITLDEEITAEGNWTVTVPAGVIGDQTWDESDYMTGAVNPQLDIYYTIGTPSTELNVIADPANGSTVESLQKITLTFPDQEYAAGGYNDELVGTVKNADGETVAEFNCYKIDFDWDTPNKVYLTLSEAITADGTYTVNFPAGIIVFGEMGDVECQSFSLTYTIGNGSQPGEQTDVVSDPADGSTVASLGTITLTWPEGKEIGIGNGMISFVNEAGETVKRADAMQYYVDPNNWDEICHIVTIEANITEKGTYKMVCPAGYFYISGTESEEMTFTYTVGDAAGINGLNADAEGAKTIFTVGGQKVQKASQKGLYIVNGKKTVVK